MKDWRGNPVEVGARVVYPGRSGSAMWLNEGIVEEMGETHLKVQVVRQHHGSTRKVSHKATVRRTDMVTVV